MASYIKKEKLGKKDLYLLIGIFFMYFFGYICPSFGGITPLGMRMVGVLIGLIFTTCVGCNIIVSALLALMAMVIGGYLTTANLLTKWTGSTTTFQLVFCGALCLALRESGAMDVLSKKMLTAKITKGRPAVLMLMILFAGFITSIFIGGAPFFLIYFGLIDSIVEVAGYDKNDKFVKYALLGIYVSGYGLFFIPWKGAMAATVAIFDAVLNPLGFKFDTAQYMLIQVCTFVGFDIIYVLAMKYIFKVDLSKLAALDVNEIESLKAIPDHFDKRMKVMLGSLLFCVAYALLISFAPKTWPGYSIWGSLTITLIWLVPLVILSVIPVDGEIIVNLPKLTTDSSSWTMISLVGSLTLLGTIATDTELGIRTWLVNIFQPIFQSMPVWAMFAVITIFVTLVTQVVHGQVLTMGVTPVIGPIFCSLALAGETANPTIALTIISQCAQVAFLFVSGSVNAAYLLERKEIDQKFLFTSGVAVLCLFIVWQYIVACVLNMVLPATML